MLTFISLKAPEMTLIVSMGVIQEEQTKHEFISGLLLRKQLKSVHQNVNLDSLCS